MDCCAHEGVDAGDARFEVRKVGDGVWVAVAAPAYKVNCNTAIIENDDGVMVVDTHSKPSAARVIVGKLRELTSKPVRYVVNTHFHWDHYQGNEAYPAAWPQGLEIIASEATRESIEQRCTAGGEAGRPVALVEAPVDIRRPLLGRVLGQDENDPEILREHHGRE